MKDKIRMWAGGLMLLLVIATGSRADNIDSLENQLAGQLSDSLRINTLIELAVSYRNLDAVKAFTYVNEATELIDRSNAASMRGKLFFTRANLHLNRADYTNALLYFFKALRFYEQQQKLENASRCLNNIGVVYSYLKKLNLAEQYFMESLAIREKHGYHEGNGVLYSSIGYTKSERGDMAGAIRYYHHAIAAAKTEKDSGLLASVYNNLGNVHVKQGNPMLGERYLKEALMIAKILNDYYYITISYLYLSQLEVERKNYTLAESYVKLSQKFASKAHINPQLTEATKSLSEIYFLRQKYKEAYEARLEYEVLNDSALNEDSYKQVNELQARYDLEKKNNEIVLLSKDKQIAQAATSRQQLLRNILIVICLLILVLVVVLVRNMRLKQRLNLSLKTENRALTEENILTKYELLKSKVEPHFLFNSLNTLSSIVTIDKERAIEFIGHFSTLYRSILESGDLPLLPLSQEIEIIESYLYLQKVRFGDKLEVDISLPGAERYKLPPFALQMTIENAVKHNVISTARRLSIKVYLEDNRLVVENNLQRKNRTEVSTGIGQKNITERYKLLGAGLPVFEQTEQVYRVTLPLLNFTH